MASPNRLAIFFVIVTIFVTIARRRRFACCFSVSVGRDDGIKDYARSCENAACHFRPEVPEVDDDIGVYRY